MRNSGTAFFPSSFFNCLLLALSVQRRSLLHLCLSFWCTHRCRHLTQLHPCILLHYDDCLPFLAAPLLSQVWEAACGADSPLLAPGTAARLAPEDASVAAEAAEVLLTQVSQGAAPQAFACLSACLPGPGSWEG